MQRDEEENAKEQLCRTDEEGHARDAIESEGGAAALLKGMGAVDVRGRG